MSFIVHIPPEKMPRCRHCGQELDFWVPGLPMDEHAHTKCEAHAIAEGCLKIFEDEFKKRMEAR